MTESFVQNEYSDLKFFRRDVGIGLFLSSICADDTAHILMKVFV